ncbi:caspase family protein [Algoriphagus litoralis]|uniref:caspase family protein n=1 Tax=Algoriphagus litoralis TaxID=2202829 RepID=UPI000DBA7D0B|nr:caspase family protein [Algoriphagus litoralis]
MRKYAILIGNDTLDISHYGGDFGLNAPINDLDIMKHICNIENISYTKLYNTGSEQVNAEIYNLSKESVSGDFVLIYFSGHGTQIPHSNDGEDDEYSESWCLYDRCFIDNEINSLLGGFTSGVRVLLISDSCHSGSIAKIFPGLPSNINIKSVSGVYERNKGFYDGILRDVSPNVNLDASVISITACQDYEVAKERAGYSDFTRSLDIAWNHGSFRQGYKEFVELIRNGLRSYGATPQLDQLGFNDKNFLNSKPF